MFSLGIIFHILLLGNAPFPGTKHKEVLEQNKKCQINFESYQYKKLRKVELDLLKKMLEKDPNQRISAKDALNHQFFAEDKPSAEEVRA